MRKYVTMAIGALLIVAGVVTHQPSVIAVGVKTATDAAAEEVR